MDIWESGKLMLFLVFVIPGFIGLKTYSILSPGKEKDSTQQLLEAITFSCFNYALMLVPIYFVETGRGGVKHTAWYGVFYFGVLFVMPIFLAGVLRWARTWEWTQNSIPHPDGKPWDHVFRKRKPYWVLVTFSNGRVIAGKYSDNSFASSNPDSEQLYLEENWLLNEHGGFERPRTDSAGVIVLSKDIESIELFHMRKELSDDEQKGQK